MASWSRGAWWKGVCRDRKRPILPRAGPVRARGGADQRMFIQRLFGRSVMGPLGIRVESVVGRVKFPINSVGAGVAAKAEGTAANDAAAAVIDENEMVPHKITGRFDISAEAMASIQGIDPGLSMDLVNDARSQMYSAIINGNGTAPNVAGVLDVTNASNPTNVVTFADAASAAAAGVDGIHATMESEVSVLLGESTHTKFSALYTASGEFAALDRLTARARTVQVSSYMPAVASTIQKAILHSGPADRSDAIAALFGGGVEIVRDPYSKASQGVTLTCVLLWAFQIIHSAYTELRFKLS